MKEHPRTKLINVRQGAVAGGQESESSVCYTVLSLYEWASSRLTGSAEATWVATLRLPVWWGGRAECLGVTQVNGGEVRDRLGLALGGPHM